MKLHDAFARGSSEEALYYTCIYLKEGKTDELEDIWIEVSASIGERMDMPYYYTWTHINKELLRIIKDERIHIADALNITAMLLLLYLRVKNNSKNVATNLKLKKEIVEHFPEGSLLSYRGQEVFRRILPNDSSPTFEFCHRILAGLTKLLDEKRWNIVRNSIEYIYKKKLEIPLTNKWPAPNDKEAHQGHPCWFLWGALLCGNNSNNNDENVATNYELYIWNWKPSYKKTRCGLLYGIVHILSKSNEIQPTWSAKEEIILNKIKEHAMDLWNQVRNENTNNEDNGNESEEELEEGNMDGVYHLQRLLPRSIQMRVLPPPTEDFNDPKYTRTIDITKQEKKGKDIKEKRTKIKKESEQQNETSDSDSRFRWFDFSPKRF